MTSADQFRLRVPDRLGTRCKLGAIMWRYLAQMLAIEAIRKAEEANVVRTVEDIDGRKWTEVRELDFGDVK